MKWVTLAVFCLAALKVVAVPINVAVVEKIVDRKIAKVLQLLTPQHCATVGLELANLIKQSGDLHAISILAELGLAEVADAVTNNRNWTVFQRRTDGSVNFYREWNDYVTGFGNTNGELWLGLETIHQLTRLGDKELEIKLIDEDGNMYYAKYSYFKVGSAATNYTLHIRGFSGNASETMRIHNNRPFTTSDRDNDNWLHGNCGYSNKAAWWYHRCGDANLNGRYNDQSLWTGVVWYHWDKRRVLRMRFTEMKFRQRIRPYEQIDD